MSKDSSEFTGGCQEVFERYLENANEHGTKAGFRCARQAVRQFMGAIEGDPALGIITAADAVMFRQEVFGAVFAWQRKHRSIAVPYTAYQRLAKAIERHVRTGENGTGLAAAAS